MGVKGNSQIGSRSVRSWHSELAFKVRTDLWITELLICGVCANFRMLVSEYRNSHIYSANRAIAIKGNFPILLGILKYWKLLDLPVGHYSLNHYLLGWQVRLVM